MEVKTLTKKLPLSLLPYQVYAALCDHGAAKNTALLETAEPGTHNSKRSITMVSAAVKIESCDSVVTLTSLNDNGNAFLAGLSPSLEQLDSITCQVETDRIQLTLDKSAGQAAYRSEAQRLKAASCLDILALVTQQLRSGNQFDDQSSCLIGVMSFDLVDQFESLPQVDKKQADYLYYVADQLVIQDDDSQSAKIVVKGFADYASQVVRLGTSIESIESKLMTSNPPAVFPKLSHQPVSSNAYSVDVSDQSFADKVGAVQAHITNGDAFQVVLARHFSVPCTEPFAAYKVLRQANPGPYMYFLQLGDSQLFGSSPESALKISAQRQVSLYPIAGTRKRALDVNGVLDFEQDAKTEYELLSDAKESAEHMMLVDLARNDLAKIIKSGTRQVTQLKRIVKYSNVMHMVSEVVGELADDIEPTHAYRACANMGTLTGAPKIKALEVIRQQEQQARGFYGGAVAIYNANHEFDSAIVIRSALVKDGQATVSAGAGIVYDSIPELEAKETIHKAQAVLNACLVAQQLVEESAA